MAKLCGTSVSDSALWVGAPAVQAHVQSSGLADSEWSSARSEADFMRVYVQKKPDAQAIHKVQRKHGPAFQVKTSSARKLWHARVVEAGEAIFVHYRPFVKETLKDKLDLLCCELEDKPPFEQVVIGSCAKPRACVGDGSFLGCGCAAGDAYLWRDGVPSRHWHRYALCP